MSAAFVRPRWRSCEAVPRRRHCHHDGHDPGKPAATDQQGDGGEHARRVCGRRPRGGDRGQLRGDRARPGRAARRRDRHRVHGHCEPPADAGEHAVCEQRRALHSAHGQGRQAGHGPQRRHCPRLAGPAPGHAHVAAAAAEGCAAALEARGGEEGAEGRGEGAGRGARSPLQADAAQRGDHDGRLGGLLYLATWRRTRR